MRDSTISFFQIVMYVVSLLKYQESGDWAKSAQVLTDAARYSTQPLSMQKARH